jgi:hypothetical protein
MRHNIYNGVLSFLKKNEVMLFAEKCIKLKTIMLSEISQVQKVKYGRFLLICGI